MQMKKRVKKRITLQLSPIALSCWADPATFLPSAQILLNAGWPALLVSSFFSFHVEGRWPKATKIRQKNPTEVPVPGKVVNQWPKEWDRCLDTSLLKEFKS